MGAPPTATWEIKAARLLVRLLEDRKAPVDPHLQRLANVQFPDERARPRLQEPPRALDDLALTRSMAETDLAGYRSILRNHPDLSDEERRIIEDSIRQTEDLLGVLRQDEQGT
jgi:hypothetical protein